MHPLNLKTKLEMKDKIEALNKEGKSHIEYGADLFQQQQDRPYRIPTDKRFTKKKGMFDIIIKKKPKSDYTDQKDQLE